METLSTYWAVLAVVSLGFQLCIDSAPGSSPLL